MFVSDCLAFTFYFVFISNTNKTSKIFKHDLLKYIQGVDSRIIIRAGLFFWLHDMLARKRVAIYKLHVALKHIE